MTWLAKLISLITIFQIFCQNCILAQDMAIGQWRSHLPFNKAKLVAEGSVEIYCGLKDGLFVLNKQDFSMRIVTKVEGLSDVELSVLKYNPYGDIIFIGYENGNIDLIRSSIISNIPDLKQKSLIGSKRVNDVFFFNKYAYVATDAGILYLDLDREETKESFILNNSGNNNSVYAVATDGVTLFAATDSGVFSSPLNNPAISFFATWTKIYSADPGYLVNKMVWLDGKLVISAHQTSTNQDKIYYLDGFWQDPGIQLFEIRSLRVKNNLLTIAASFDIKIFNNNFLELKYISNFSAFAQIRDAVTDNNDPNTVWFADSKKGLVKALTSSSYQIFAPNGPTSELVSVIKISNGQLWVGHSGYRSNRWDPAFSNDGFSTLKNNVWKTFGYSNTQSPIMSFDTIKDFMALAIDPRNSDHVFLGSRGKGLVEFENQQVKNYFNEFNSAIQTIPNFAGVYWMGEMAFDADYNLWMLNSNVPASLIQYRADGTWKAYSFTGIPTNGVLLGEMMLDSYGQIWINRLQSGLIVVNSAELNKTPIVYLDSNGLASNDVRAFAEDKDGQVWIGTTMGINVVYSPGTNPQRILIFQDGSYQYLLETEVVTSIAIDGANRKWFGTESSGVFLLSSDGTKQIHHFTAENSPLLSNRIQSIAIDELTGIVYFGTDRGIVAYRSDAVEGKDHCENTYVFPNPVRPDYSGPIAISGLMKNGNVKITDISGTLVYETTALGGQAIWSGKNFSGAKAQTGVYLVFCSDADGKNTCITKLLFIN